MKSELLLSGVSALGLLWSVGAQAQDAGQAPAPAPAQAAEGAAAAPASRDGEILVTANRREQNVQDVGLVVNQFSAEDLRAAAITKTADIAQAVPGVYVAGAFGGQSQQFNIRGVTQSDYIDTIENPVAFYIDDVYVTASQGQSMGLYDVQRVEILKGPQGTLFGRNATGGLVHVIPERPTLHQYEGNVQFTYARFNEVNAQAGLNVPLGDVAALRVSGLYARVDNFWKNRYPEGGAGSQPILSFGPNGNTPGLPGSPCCENVGGNETYSGRGQFLFEPTDALKVRLTASYAHTAMSTGPYTQEPTIAIIDDQGRVVGGERVAPDETRIAIGPGGSNYLGAATIIPLANGIFARPTPGGNYFGYIPRDPKKLELSEEYAIGDLDKVTSQIYAGHIDYDIGGATISSVTAYQKYSKDVYIGDGSPTNSSGFGGSSDTRAWSQELRISGESDRFRWQFGAFYLDNKVHLLQGILATPRGAIANLFAIFAGNPALVDFGTDINTDLNFRSKSISAFGQAEFDFADRWTLIGGARYIHENQHDEYRSFNALSTDNYKVEDDIILGPGVQPNYSDRRKFNLWAGKLQIEFRPTDDWLLYAGINRGVKAGNYNAPFALSAADVVSVAEMSYKPEILLSYEAGFKFKSGPVTFNNSAFYYDYKGFQAFVFSSFAGIIRNVDSKVYGIDSELYFDVTPDLKLGGSFAYTHAQIKNFEIAPGVFRTVRPPYAPRMQAMGTVDYHIPAMVAGGEVSLHGSVNYAGAIYHNIRNFDADRFNGRTLVDLSATWKEADSGLSVTVYGKNIFDVRYGQVGFDNTLNGGGNQLSYGPPATYGVTMAYQF